MTTNWSDRYAARMGSMQSSVIRELLKLTQQPDVISFAGGLPAPELFPREAVLAATGRVLDMPGGQALQYGTTEGYTPLREMIAAQLTAQGAPCGVENVLITTGSQQALDLIGKVFLDPGDVAVVDEPTYLGALQAWTAYQPAFVSVEMDDEGTCPDRLEAVLKAHSAKLIYALPTFQNPTGLSLAADRREALVRLAREYGVTLIEDDPYGQLRYEGEFQTPLLAIDAEIGGGIENGNVLYLGTFSKTLCPGFRVAWMVGPSAVIGRMAQAKQGVDLHTSTFAQMVAHETARDGFVEQHVLTIREVYGARRDLMLHTLEETFPAGVSWTHPQGGLFLWVRLPEGVNAAEMLPKAVGNKVAFVPGHAFFAEGGGENTMRMNFSNATEEQIEVGIRRLAGVIAAELEATAV